jgi:hypothetical protein
MSVQPKVWSGIKLESFWGTKVREQIPIGTFRCAVCGYLESYAQAQFGWKYARPNHLHQSCSRPALWSLSGSASMRTRRPAIPSGVKGWGAKGELDLGLIERLAKTESE